MHEPGHGRAGGLQAGWAREGCRNLFLVTDHRRSGSEQVIGAMHALLLTAAPEAVWESLHANHPSSSSRREGAGNGAPGPSCVGSLT
jgi:hypothetical protein